MALEEVIIHSNGVVRPKQGINPRKPYEHQIKASERLDIMNRDADYSTLVVLPTGGGKTYTLSVWLLRHAIDKGTKILWIAHRQTLLDQAAESFYRYAYAENLPHTSSFKYRIISGASEHDKPSHIHADDNLLIISKDSIGRNLSCLDRWLAKENEIFLIIDEAHHAPAKTYRKVIDYVKKKVHHVKLIGITATPFRTAEDEQGLLANIFPDGIKNGKAVHGEVGIAYQIGLKDLIARQILSKPIFESYQTEESFGDSMGIDAWESIQRLDIIPHDIAEKMAKNVRRNEVIVQTYLKRRKEYGQTIVFAIDQTHAIQLTKQFKESHINADYIISSIRNAFTGASIDRARNERKLQDYRDGKLDVLINVNILTEGVDLPKTKTVFLARPTVSTILMTQMVGRALRGTVAGGTDSAYIVSFVDNWNEHISWVNPETLFIGNNDFTDDPKERTKRTLRMISIAKIEEFARILSREAGMKAIIQTPFQQRIPIGMYAFSYEEEGGADTSYQVIVYNSTKQAYENLMKNLPRIFRDFKVTEDEYLSNEMLEKMQTQCRDRFFKEEMVPPYEPEDIKRILKYYAQQGEAPRFRTFDEIDRSKLDVAAIAKHIYDEDMGPRKETDYLNSLWESEESDMLRLFFGLSKIYFLDNVENEKRKLTNPHLFDEEQNVEYGTRSLEDMTLYDIGKHNPELEKKLRDEAFEKSKNRKGEYRCALCGMTSRSRAQFHVDHIRPLSKGGKSIAGNLQILCHRCNGKKGDN